MRVGRVDSIVPGKEELLARLDRAEDLETVKSIVADLINTVGTYIFARNEKTGETILGQFGVAGGGNLFFTNTDHQGQAIRFTKPQETLPTEDRVSDQVQHRATEAKAARVTVGKRD